MFRSLLWLRVAAPAILFAPVAQAQMEPAGSARLDLVGSQSWLTADRGDWQDGSARLVYGISTELNGSAAVQVSHRFGLTSDYFEGRVDTRPSSWLGGYFFAGGAPASQFLPRDVEEAGISARLYQQPGVVNATVLTANENYANYVTGPVRRFVPGMEQYFFDGRFWLTAQWLLVNFEHGGSADGYVVRGDWQVTDTAQLFLAGASGPETTLGGTFPSHSIYGGADIEIRPGLTLRLTAAHEQIERLYDRTELTAGVSFGL